MLFNYRKLYKVHFFLLIAFIYLLKHSYAYDFEIIGRPYIQNFTANIYLAENKNFSIIQDSSGIIYFGNTNCILEFDNNNWNKIVISGIPHLTINNNRIYTAAYNDFGEIVPNKSGASTFKSLFNTTSFYNLNFGQFENIFSLDSIIFFNNKNNIFKFQNNKVSIIYSDSLGLKSFFVHNQLFIESRSSGLLKYDNDSFVPLFNKTHFLNKNISFIIPFKNQDYIIYKNNKLFFYNSHKIKEITSTIFSTQNIQISCATKISDKLCAIGTKKQGIIIINSDGDIIKTLNNQQGLISNEINDLFVDRQGNLWAATNYGISIIEFPSPFLFYDNRIGLMGSVNNIQFFNNLLYIATTQGLYTLSYSNNDFYNFETINCINSNISCNSLYIIYNNLFVSTNDGVYFLKENKPVKMLNDTWFVAKQSNTQPNCLLIANEKGFSILETINGKKTIKFSLTNIPNDYNSIAEDNNQIWIGTNYNGLFKIDYNQNYDSITGINQYYDVANNLKDKYWIKAFTTSHGILFSTPVGIYKYNSKTDSFYKDTILFDDIEYDNYWIDPLVENNQNIWINYGPQNSFGNRIIKTNGKKPNSQMNNWLNRIANTKITSILPHNNNIWFGTDNGLIRIDTSYIQKKINNYTIFRKIIINETIVIKGKNIKNKYILPHNQNCIKFEYASPTFYCKQKNSFQYKLSNYNKNWSEWSHDKSKEYTNLASGIYVFKVRSKDIYNNISSITQIQIEIITPFYATNVAFVLYFILLLLLIILILKWRSYYYAVDRYKLEQTINTRTKELIEEKEKTENLLANYLPKETLEKLAETQKNKTTRYKMVTILFADIIGLNQLSKQHNATELIDLLDRFFFHFDEIVEKLNIVKIKTVGDTYMCAGGIPQKNRTNPIEVVLAAFEMQQYLENLKNQYPDYKMWDIRIGIHTGPVFAEVNTKKKHSYDIWGETVNTASRMESSGEVSKVNISGNTYELIRSYFICQYRGKMPVKYKGDLDMYFIMGFRPKLSLNNQGMIPNQTFKTKLSLIRFDDLEEFVLNKLEKSLPKNLFYHNLKHTIDVIIQAEIIGRAEKVTDEEMLYLKTAALFHDSGFMFGYQDHELLSINFANKILPGFSYSEKQIKIINELIFSTQLPPQPKNKLQEIMCDADLDYLGRIDFIPVSQTLFKEMVEHGKIEDNNDKWNKLQIKFIAKHQYFTDTAKSLRDVNKKKQLETIRNLVNNSNNSK